MIDLYKAVKDMSSVARMGFAAVTDRGMNLVLLTEAGKAKNEKREADFLKVFHYLTHDDGCIRGEKEFRILFCYIRRLSAEELEFLTRAADEALAANASASDALGKLDHAEPAWCSWCKDYHARIRFWPDRSSKKLNQTNSFCIEGHNDHQSRWGKDRSRKKREAADPLGEAARSAAETTGEKGAAA